MTLVPLLEGAAYVAGVDHSRSMVQRALNTFSTEVKEEHANFYVAEEKRCRLLPLPFKKVCTVNTIYFWKSLETGFIEIRRVLAQDGRLVVGFSPKDRRERFGVPTDIART